MSRVLITGSTEGLGLMAARLLPATDTRSRCMPAAQPGPRTHVRPCPQPGPSSSATCPASRACGRSPSKPTRAARTTRCCLSAPPPSPTTCGRSSPSSASARATSLLPHFPHDKAQHRRSRRSADSQGRPAHRGSSPGMASYQDAIHYWVTTIYPYGCAPVCTEHSVDVIAQTSTCGRVRHLADDIRGRIPEHQQSLRVRLLARQLPGERTGSHDNTKDFRPGRQR